MSMSLFRAKTACLCKCVPFGTLPVETRGSILHHHHPLSHTKRSGPNYFLVLLGGESRSFWIHALLIKSISRRWAQSSLRLRRFFSRERTLHFRRDRTVLPKSCTIHSATRPKYRILVSCRTCSRMWTKFNLNFEPGFLNYFAPWANHNLLSHASVYLNKPSCMFLQPSSKFRRTMVGCVKMGYRGYILTSRTIRTDNGNGSAKALGFRFSCSPASYLSNTQLLNVRVLPFWNNGYICSLKKLNLIILY
ncbi:hypothetical protein PsorP6_003245 [Peronosclerospora sorghi]|uniref:Uncharacterized protein n=1 Tax=Peronosclerospora sorghi TaxID=230839 RepID=A0ACC0VRR9_9STRA|nr:hypothetical protein PsorP6_003245 [Peronosclerospora sorghi]